MFIICPKCFTQYAISDEIRVKKGQKFHCSACQNYFVLKQNEKEAGEDESEIIPTVSSVMQATQQETLAEIGVSIPVNQGVEQTLTSAPVASVAPVVMPSETPQVAPTPIPTPTPAIPSLSEILPDPLPAMEEALARLTTDVSEGGKEPRSIPEEFKPVQKKPQKTSGWGTLLWLALAGGICYGAYLQKDFLIEQLDSFIVNQLDKSAQKTNRTIENETKVVSSELNESGNKASVKTDKLSSDTSKKAETNRETLEKLPESNPPEPVQKAETEKNFLKETTDTSQIKADTAEEIKAHPVPSENKTPVNLVEAANNTEPLPALIPENTPPVPVVSAKTEIAQAAVPSAEPAQAESPSAESAQTASVSNEETASANKTLEMPALSGQVEELPEMGLVPSELPELTGETHQKEVLPGLETSVQEPVPNSSVSVTSASDQATLSVQEIAQILKIQNISYSIAPNEAGVERLMIKGEIANTELKTLVIPEIKAVVYNDEDTVVARKRIILSQAQIEGNSVQPFFSSVVPAPHQVSRVEVVFDE